MILRLAFALPLLAAALPAVAPAETVTAVVHYEDLNLASDAGVAALHRRLEAAVTRVVGQADPRDLTAQRMVDASHRAALAGVEPQMQAAIAAARDGARYAAVPRSTVIVASGL